MLAKTPETLTRSIDILTQAHEKDLLKRGHARDCAIAQLILGYTGKERLHAGGWSWYHYLNDHKTFYLSPGANLNEGKRELDALPYTKSEAQRIEFEYEMGINKEVGFKRVITKIKEIHERSAMSV